MYAQPANDCFHANVKKSNNGFGDSKTITSQNDISFVNTQRLEELASAYGLFNAAAPPDCDSPRYNRPYKACIDTITSQPFLLDCYNRSTSTAAYPVTDTTYTLYTEHFNSVPDTPFASYLRPCDSRINRVAYYVFSITKESYVQINTSGFWAQVFDRDVRKDSLNFSSLAPVQPCVQSYGQVQLCRLQPGIYTLVLFASDDNVPNGCGEVTPTVYVASTGYSRFDHAVYAYDFDVIPSDSVYHNGKTGDKNPLHASRAPSNDFFFCTTGSQINDPAEAASCNVEYDSLVYKNFLNNYLYEGANANKHPRRNLWYTFVIDKPGYVHVKVNNKTPGKTSQYPFGIYRSDVDGTLPFINVVYGGLVDSTIDQGLTYIVNNHTSSCDNSNEASFYIEPCTFSAPLRYYLLVENPYDMEPNSQAEVEIMLDSTSAVKSKFDHYYQADTIGVNLGPGTYQGHKDNFMCATANVADPDYYSCRPKTLWYKFTVAITGHIKFRIQTATQNFYDYTQVQLLREVVAGDSTKNGLYYQPATAVQDNNGIYWSQQCISPGTYYLLLTGCNQPDGDVEVYPEIQLSEESGDFCSAPAVANLTGAGTSVSTVTVDCHTIGTDYGEFMSTLSCPAGAKTADYKSSWFRIDITGTDTLDVTTFLDVKTNATSSDIKYRMMKGDCGAMEEQDCVQDAVTPNAYSCLAPGSYYIQVFTPVKNSNGDQVTGDIDLHVTAVKHTGSCIPDTGCLATSKFTYEFDCAKDSAVHFNNNSTYGSSITYQWDFGYAGNTSSSVSPTFFYPALSKDSVYTVRLITTNIGCNKADTASLQVTLPARPYVNFGKDLILCNYDTSIVLNATSFAGANYLWQDGTTNPSYTVTAKGDNQYAVKVTYNNCITTDTIHVFINQLQKQQKQQSILCKDSVQLSDNRNYNPTYEWNTGQTASSVYAKKGGDYWVDINNNNCIIRDSFNVITASTLHPLGNDTALCFGKPYTLDATLNIASNYQWLDGSTGAQHNIADTGTYWVDITLLGGCIIRDSIKITYSTGVKPVITEIAFSCVDHKITLDAGSGYTSYVWENGAVGQYRVVNAEGDYVIATKSSDGCFAKDTISIKIKPTGIINNDTLACAYSSFNLKAKDALFYKWFPLRGLDNDTAQNPLLTVDTSQTYYLTSTFFSDNLITNGDFEQGSYATNSQYTFCNTSNCLYSLGYYSIGYDANVFHSGFQGKDHTTGKGNFMMVNAGSPSLITWQQKVHVTQNTDYAFGLWICALTAKNPAKLKFMINGQQVGAIFTAPELYFNWVQAVMPWNSGTSDTAFIQIMDVYDEASGNDFGLDDIFFGRTFSCKDSVRVNMQKLVTNNLEASLCNGQSYTMPSGIVLNTSGYYSDTVRNISGCDSLITHLNLKVGEPIRTSVDTILCANQTYTLPSGTIIAKAGDYADTVRAVFGCDSIITNLQLNFHSLTITALTTYICEGSIYTLPSGQIINADGVYKDTIRNSAGCDSIITTVTLSVFRKKNINETKSLCAGQSYTLPSGLVADKTGAYSDTVRNVNGCDSLITQLNLTVADAVKLVDTSSVICYNQSYQLPSGIIVKSSGIYQDTIRNINGCDSLITTLHLTVQDAAIKYNKDVSICQGEAYTLPSGLQVSQPGTYIDTLHTSIGCDSIIATINLAVFNVNRISKDVQVCARQTYTLPSGLIVNTEGTYLDTLKNQFGCDSLITTVNLTIFSLSIVAVNASICDGSSYTLPSGTTINVSGIFRDTLRNAFGCDSLITTVTLSVNKPLLRTADVQVCNGEVYTMPSGNQVSVTGTYVDTLKSTQGCDSLITTVNLVVVAKATRISSNATICGGQTYTLPNGIIVNKAGIYSDTLKNSAGCDSLIRVVNLTVNSIAQQIDKSVIICAGQTYTLPWGTVVNASGTYSDTLRGSLRCDSIINNVTLTVQPVPLFTVTPASASICPGDSIMLKANGGDEFKWSNPQDGFYSTDQVVWVRPGNATTYFVSITNRLCNVTGTASSVIGIKPRPFITLSKSNDVDCMVGTTKLQATGGSRYLWYPAEGLSNANISNPVAAPSATTVYHVQVSSNDKCTAEDSIKVVVYVGDVQNGYLLPAAFTPNNDGLNDCFGVKTWGYVTDLKFSVYDRWGYIVFTTTNPSECWDGTYKGHKKPAGTYVYQVSAKAICGNVYRKGTIVLIR